MSRVFVVGSGKSLRNTPINDLMGEDLFVMNKANEVWEHLGFTVKPKYYFKQDYSPYDKKTWKDQVYWAHENCESLFLWKPLKNGHPEGHPNHEDMPDGVGELDRVEWFEKCHHSDYMPGSEKAVHSWHLPSICTAFGSMNPVLQLCVQMGYDDIYLVGCDLYSEKGNDHATPTYDTYPKDKNDFDNRNMTAIHEMAARCSPIPIFNATVGGSLEVYPRVNINDII